jgi:hypothetical protein
MAAYVQDTGIVRVASGGSTSTATFASATTLGNAIIASGGVFATTGFFLSFSDKIGGSATTNAWNARRNTAYSGGEARGFIVDSLSLAQAGSSHEVDVTSDQGSGNYYTWAAAEFSGITSYDATASSETSGTGGNISSYAVTSGTFGTNPFVFAALGIDSANNHNPGSNNLGGTQLFSELDATTWMCAAGAYAQKAGTGGTQTVTWSFTFGTTIGQWAGLAVYNTSAAAPTIVQQPASATINDGEYWYGWVISDHPGTDTYQWQQNTGSGWTDVVGQTTSYFAAATRLHVADSGIQYRCNVTNGGGTTASNAATITVQTPRSGTAGEWDPMLVIKGWW